MSRLEVLPATAGRWSDVDAVFGARGCSVARGCWCMFYRHRGKGAEPPAGQTQAQMYRDQLRRLTRRDPPPGLVGYRGGVPVGWVSLGPREDFAKLQHSPVMKPVDDEPVWSIICFVVPAEHRRQGVAGELLRGAIDFARQRDRLRAPARRAHAGSLSGGPRRSGPGRFAVVRRQVDV
ncbi:MAG TPA: GNAT family N-acetyltransferase [Pseudomonadales bacterium]